MSEFPGVGRQTVDSESITHISKMGRTHLEAYRSKDLAILQVDLSGRIEEVEVMVAHLLDSLRTVKP